MLAHEQGEYIVKLSNPLLIFGTVLFIFFGFLFTLLYFIWPIQELSVAKSGVFGDSFGVLSALFNGLALGGLVLTITEQKNEFRQQHFENIFFEMVRLHVDMTAEIDLKMRDKDGNEIVTEGRDCFSIFYEKLNKAFSFQEQNHPKKSEEERFSDAYDHFWGKWHKELGHYFRSLYTIFKYIKESKIDDKKQYANIIRSQLSDYELLVLFYNCLSPHGEAKFKPLVEEYELFDNMPIEKLNKPADVSRYAISAFGSNPSFQPTSS